MTRSSLRAFFCSAKKRLRTALSSSASGDVGWEIRSWDAHGLLASYDPNVSAVATSDRCHHHVLTMTFASGAVSTSDIPTRAKGCEEFPETNSYRLVRGNYYVDTSPANDLDMRK